MANNPSQRLYYKDDPTCLHICSSQVHMLLHIADYIQAIGPVWVSWQFAMECYCGDLSSHVANLHYPYANMAECILSKSTIYHLQNKYDLGELLGVYAHDGLKDSECMFPECKYLMHLGH